ncbi:MAG: hypothetical protein ACP5RT_01815 [Candidatus Micrarchaeia archaeon]
MGYTYRAEQTWPYTKKTKNKLVTALEHMWCESEAKKAKDAKIDYAALADIAKCIMSIVEVTVISKKIGENKSNRKYELEVCIENGKVSWQLTGNTNEGLPVALYISILYAYYLNFKAHLGLCILVFMSLLQKALTLPLTGLLRSDAPLCSFS